MVVYLTLNSIYILVLIPWKMIHAEWGGREGRKVRKEKGTKHTHNHQRALKHSLNFATFS